MDTTKGSSASTSLLEPLNGKFIYKKNEDRTINKNAACVYSEEGEVFDVMLNQTNIQEKNNNKFYQIQLLHDVSKGYSVWIRHGRVGEDRNYWGTEDGKLTKAKDFFKKKFRNKTKNEWENRENFKKVKNKYDIYDNTNKKLNEKIQSLLQLIFDREPMEEMKKIPLGKLTSEQIDAGDEALTSIGECLDRKGTEDKLKELCSRFYTRIPHDFGRLPPPIIRTKEELKKKKDLLKELRDIVEHPLDRQYHSLQCDLQPLDSSSNDKEEIHLRVIEKYLQTTNDSTDMTVLDIFSVNKKEESDNFLSQLHNRTLLWYGSHLSNWVGILREGLPLAPPVAPTTSSEFGIHFNDMSSEAARSCSSNKKNPDGLLLLCEVALGDCNEQKDANYEANNLPEGKHSTKELGRTGPDPSNSVTLDDGVIVPMGPGVTREGYSLPYNKYIVYNRAQVRMRYLLRIRFNYS